VALLITALLPLAITFPLLRVVLPISLPIARVSLAPLPRTLLADLSLNRIGTELVPVMISAASPLARGLAADELLRIISGRLKNVLAVRATTTIHQVGSGSECDRIILFGTTLGFESPAKNHRI
jgi:hypothetical protein